MDYHLIYDGKCNLCVTFTQLLEQFDRGRRFDYIPMQDQERLAQLGVSEADCKLGMILIDVHQPQRRWQGSEAAEEITRRLPLGEAFIAAYRALPGVKAMGDHTYEQVRDNRYQWFGGRKKTYQPKYSFCDRSDSDCSIDADTSEELSHS